MVLFRNIIVSIGASMSLHFSPLFQTPYSRHLRPILNATWTPLRNKAKMQFFCVFYVVIRGQKPVLKKRTPGFK